MKVKKLGIEWGAAFEEAQPVQITQGEAMIVVYVSEKGELVVRTQNSGWRVTSEVGGSCRLVVEN